MVVYGVYVQSFGPYRCCNSENEVSAIFWGKFDFLEKSFSIDLS